MNYPYAGIFLIEQDDANNRGEYTADDLTWTSLGAGTRSIAGVLLYEHVDGTDANDRVVAFSAKTATPDSNDFPINWDTTGGILQIA